MLYMKIIQTQKAASRVIDLYKTDMTKSKSKNTAAFAVSTKKGRTTPQADETSSYLRESQVNKMTDREYSQAFHKSWKL